MRQAPPFIAETPRVAGVFVQLNPLRAAIVSCTLCVRPLPSPEKRTGRNVRDKVRFHLVILARTLLSETGVFMP